jgi:hypothetical protein
MNTHKTPNVSAFSQWGLLPRRHRQVVDLVWWLRGLVVVAIAARYKGYRYPIDGCDSLSWPQGDGLRWPHLGGGRVLL